MKRMLFNATHARELSVAIVNGKKRFDFATESIGNERRNTDRIVAMARQQDEAHEIAERIGHREDFGRPAAFRLADGLILSPPFAPWP